MAESLVFVLGENSLTLLTFKMINIGHVGLGRFYLLVHVLFRKSKKLIVLLSPKFQLIGYNV